MIQRLNRFAQIVVYSEKESLNFQYDLPAALRFLDHDFPDYIFPPVKGDLSRITHQPDKHYTSVRLQQGRVLLDADWNEQSDIVQREIRTRLRDTAGDGAPAGPHENGFRITSTGEDLLIGAGRYYVAGVIAENDAQRTFSNQPRLPGYVIPNAAEPANEGAYLAYLEVRERTLSYLEDPTLREVALGGPDTGLRTQTVAQVKLLRLADAPEDLTADSEPAEWLALVASAGAGRLRAEIDNGGGYQLPENFLYRVEIHDGGATGTANFKWSRYNAAFAALWLDASGESLLIRNAARDADKSFTVGQWIELIDEGRELRGEPGTLARIDAIDGDLIRIDPTTADGPYDLAAFSEGRRLVRAWDMHGVGAIATGENAIQLEGGLRVSFDAPGDNQYRTGDYWLIPARAITKDIEWPRDAAGEALFQSSHGEPALYSRLAFVHLLGGVWNLIADARIRFPTLSDIARSDNLIENKLNRFGDTMTGTLNIQADLNVDLDARFKQNLTVEHDLRVEGDFYVAGDIIARDTQHQPGDVLLGDQDEDAVTIHGVLKSAHSSDRLEIDDAARIAGDLAVDGAFVSGAADIQGGATISGAVDVGDNLSVAGNLAVGPGATNATFRVDVDGDVRADRFIGDGSMLTNVGNAQSITGALPELLYATNDPAKHGTVDAVGRRLFYSTISQRAPVMSPALGMFLGRRRILFDDFVRAPEERGPNGEYVYKIEGRDDLRLIGDNPDIRNDEHGNRLILRSGAGHVLEFTGYFTAVRPLFRSMPAHSGYRARIDGGAETRLALNVKNESPLTRRYYDAISLDFARFETGGPPAVHTIRITPDGDWDAYGLELIATRTDTTQKNGQPVDHTNQIDIPAQQLLLNGETTPLPAQTHDFRVDPWSNGYGLNEDSPGYFDEGLEAWEDHIALALAVADHTVPQIFDPPLNIHDHVLNTTSGVVHRVKFFKNLVSGEHQAASPDKIVWAPVCAISRTVSDITTRADLIPNEIVYSQSQARIYKVLATSNGSFATTRFNRRRPVNGSRVAWFVPSDARDESGNAYLKCATTWLPPRASALGATQGVRGKGLVTLEAFEIAGAQYVVAAYDHATGSYNQNSPLFRLDGEQLVEIQTFPTNGARAWRHFEIDGAHYLVVANHYNNSTHNIDSRIYKWNGAQFNPTPFQNLSNSGAIDCDFFTIAGQHYLAFANHHNGSTGSVNSRIYKWNGTQFDTNVFQNIGTAHARQMRHFEFAGQHFLGIMNSYNGSTYNLSSYVYKWNGTQFDTANPVAFPTNHGWGIEGFSIGARHFVAFANYHNGSSFTIPSRIYEWNGTDFVLFQEVTVTGASGIRAFSIGGESFLYFGSWSNGSTQFVDARILRWTGERFSEFQKFSTHGGAAPAVFTTNGETYLALPAYYSSQRSSYETVGPSYLWNGARFIPHEFRVARDERALGQSRPLLNQNAPDYAFSERAEFLHVWEFGNGDKNGTALVFGGFDTIRSKSNRAFHLDDGATALWARGVRQSEFNVPAVRIEDNDGTLRLAFFGTGLRVKLREDRTLFGLGGRNADGWFDLASDLSYGTHAIEFKRVLNAVTQTTETEITLDGILLARDQTSLHFEAFEIMQPRRATLPAKSLIVGEYTLVADPVQQTETGPTIQSVGTRRQHATREVFYNENVSSTGTLWNYVEAPQPDDVGGIILQSGNTAKTPSYRLPFYGEGFVVRFRDDTDLANFTIRVDGGANLLAYTTHATSGSLNPASGLFTPARNGNRASSVAALGIPLGEHYLEVTANTAANMYLYISAIDIISPLHRARHYLKHETPYLSEFLGGGAGITNHELPAFDAWEFRPAPLAELVARDRAKRARIWSVVSKSNGYLAGGRWVCDRVRGGYGNIVGKTIHFGMKGVVYGSEYGGWYIKESGTYLASMFFLGNPSGSMYLNINEETAYYAYSTTGNSHADSSPTLTLQLREGDVLHIRVNGGDFHYSYYHNQFSLVKID